jgi:hypothetical protein
MPLVASALDERPTKVVKWNCKSQHYFEKSATMSGPQAHWLESIAEGATIPPHFHVVDQFQVFTAGDGQFGRHELRPLDVQYADHFTPYGPIVAGPQGFHFMTIRATPDPDGGHYMPESHSFMVDAGMKPGRSFVVHVPVPELATIKAPALRSLRMYEDGLAVQRIDLPPHASLTGPDPAESNGQHFMVVGGRVLHDARLHPDRSLLFVTADEPALTLTAGDEGASVLVMCFPRRSDSAAA